MALEHRVKILYEDDSPLFKFLNPNDNVSLSTLSKSELEEFLRLLDDYYLVMRDRLGFDQYVTFGMEIEFENAMIKRINELLKMRIKDDKIWESKVEVMALNGGEIATPVLTDTKNDWENFRESCHIASLNGSGAIKCGGHVHIGANILGEDKNAWLNFMLLWATYENIAFRFGYGELLVERPQISYAATPLYNNFWEDFSYLKEYDSDLFYIIKAISESREQAINFQRVIVPVRSEFELNNTVEFRFFNGTFNPIIWQNYVNFSINMMLYAKSKSFNTELVMDRLERVANLELNLDRYREIFLEQALELADLIFINNFDKVYFLRQYLKSFMVGLEYEEKAKTFTLER